MCWCYWIIAITIGATIEWYILSFLSKRTHELDVQTAILINILRAIRHDKLETTFRIDNSYRTDLPKIVKEIEKDLSNDKIKCNVTYHQDVNFTYLDVYYLHVKFNKRQFATTVN